MDIKSILKNFRDKKILVIGDIMIDVYTEGEVARISPEAPVPVLAKSHERFVLGGAANVACNIATLGAKARLVGVVGEDARGKQLLGLLENYGIDGSAIVVDAGRPTTVKHRFVAQGSQLLRVDEEMTEDINFETQKKMMAEVEKFLTQSGAIIISDYGKGVLTAEVIKALIGKAKHYGKFVVADFKPKNKDYFEGVNLLTPNLREGREITGLVSPEDIGKKLAETYKGNVLLTMASEGVIAISSDGRVTRVPARKIKVHDVSGAGDTVTAVAALALTSGASLEDTAILANYAGELKVQKPGTAPVSVEELETLLNQGRHVEDVAVVPKVWGYEKWIENNDKYCSKILHINKGYQCSLHYHKIKDEMFLVTKGYVRLALDGEVMNLREGNFVRVKPGMKHRYAGLEESEMLEISTHHEDDDSHRIEESKMIE